MIGETVTVQRRVQTGVDAFNQPIIDWVDESVDDVLVAPGPRADLSEADRPEGVRIEWSLYWPKTYTEPLDNCRVIIRGDGPFSIIGDPRAYPDVNTPTRWNRPSEAWRADG